MKWLLLAIVVIGLLSYNLQAEATVSSSGEGSLPIDFYEQQISVEGFDGTYIYVSKWHSLEESVYDLNGNQVIPWQEERVYIGEESDGVFLFTFITDVKRMHEEGWDSESFEFQSHNNYYKLGQGFLFEKPLTYATEFVDGYAFIYDESMERQVIRKDGSVARVLPSSKYEGSDYQIVGGYVAISNRLNDKVSYIDIETGEETQEIPEELIPSYGAFFPEGSYSSIHNNSNNFGIVYKEDKAFLYDLSSGELRLDLETAPQIKYKLFDTYLVKEVKKDEPGWSGEIIDFEGNVLKQFDDLYYVEYGRDGILYEEEHQWYYYKIDGADTTK